ncbi:hypothetical protein ACEN2J_13970 [Pseudorhodobacter sp. W20_MBD10_FR17]|uniref:hypothetical protein n=1 Tax=Pseudorhodobacter sp. W20_MBD10_FR17 TaxID=3240266 RepID=UPI003F9BD9A4
MSCICDLWLLGRFTPQVRQKGGAAQAAIGHCHAVPRHPAETVVPFGRAGAERPVVWGDARFCAGWRVAGSDVF